MSGHTKRCGNLRVCVGNDDQRIGTDHVIAFTRKVVRAPVAAKKPARVELHG